MSYEIIKCPVCGKEARITYEEDRIYQMKCNNCKNTVLHEDKSFDAAADFFKRCVILPCKPGEYIKFYNGICYLPRQIHGVYIDSNNTMRFDLGDFQPIISTLKWEKITFEEAKALKEG